MDYYEEDEFEHLYADDMEALKDMESSQDSHDSIWMPKVPKSPTAKKELQEPVNDGIYKDQPIKEISNCSSKSSTPNSVKRLFSEFEDKENSEIQLTPPVSKKFKFDNMFTAKNTAETSPAPKRLFETSSKRFSTLTVCVTKFDGIRVYLKTFEDEEIVENFTFSKHTSTLLSAPLAELKMNIFTMMEKTSKTERKRPFERKNKNSQYSGLWVEKYKPRTFIELLSDQGVNRTVLRWLKLWDKIVFGKDISKGPNAKIKNPKFESKFQNPNLKLNEGMDEHGRPLQKITLLCGPPGLGKTTMGKVIAEHAGYNVIELNASDDRSPDIFRKCLENSLQMTAVMHRDRRPNCLVIDEIDGAPAQSINVLVSFVKSTGYSKGKRKKGDIPLLMRPIICICNDQYVPALKPLRQIALLLKLPPISKNRLASRLNEVSLVEGLKANMSALFRLCEKSENDIRSCLSTIQFLHNSKKEVNMSDVNNADLGQKDVQKSLFSVWQEIFHFSKPESKKTRTFLDPKLNVDDDLTRARFLNVHKVAQTFGDYEKVFPGIFENYLTIKANMWFDSIWEGAEWMCFVDTLQSQIYQNQLFLLAQYIPYASVAMHLLFASSAFARLSYPSAFYECISKRSQLTSILTSLTNEFVASLKGFSDERSLILDVLPSLENIIQPPLRPINTQLYSEQEKKELVRVVDVMISLNLSYRQERSSDGQYDFLLEPNIKEIVAFTGSQKTELNYFTKQLISREIMLERVRRHQVPLENVSYEKVKVKKSDSSTKKKDTKVPNTKAVSNYFIKKPIQTKNVQPAVKDPSPLEEVQDIWYYFSEGYTNAVRRRVYMKDLL